MTVRLGIFLIPFVFFFLAAAANAQTFAPAGRGAITITASPKYPSPGDFVNLTASSFSFDLDRSEITWTANGETIGQGPGMKEAVIVAGALGSGADIVVSATGQNGSSTGEAHIRPTEIDLLWESDSYTPPFYRGRALPSAGTNLRIEAIPRLKLGSGELVPEQNIIYTWRRNGSIVQLASGRGRSSLILPAPVLFGTDTITLTVETLDGQLTGEKKIIVNSLEPFLALYQDHPLFGIPYHQALSGQNDISDSEMTFAAVPYFAQIENPDNYELEYSWRVNGREIPTDLNRPSELTVNAEGSSGFALIELVLTQANNLIMRSSGKWGIQFSASGTGIDPFR